MKVRVTKIAVHQLYMTGESGRGTYKESGLVEVLFAGEADFSTTMKPSDMRAHDLRVGSWYSVNFSPTDDPTETTVEQVRA